MTSYNKKVTDRAIFVLEKVVPSQKDMEDAAEKGAEILEMEAKRRAPVRTGKLRDSVNKRLFKSTKTEASYLVYSSAFYADAVEKTPGRNKRPFMRPAFDSKQNEIVREMQSELVKIDKVTHS